MEKKQRGLLDWEKDIKKNEKVLDIGCWSGGKVLRLYNRCSIYGMDINKENLDKAPKKIRKRLFLADITKKINLGKKFDWIFLEEVLEHIEKDESALKNIRKLLKTGGKFVMTTPKSITLFECWDPAWIRWKLGLGSQHHHYSKKELFRKLEKYGLKVREFRVSGDIKWLTYRWINIFIKYILKKNKLLETGRRKGFFNWEILAEVKNE